MSLIGNPTFLIRYFCNKKKYRYTALVTVHKNQCDVQCETNRNMKLPDNKDVKLFYNSVEPRVTRYSYYCDNVVA